MLSPECVDDRDQIHGVADLRLQSPHRRATPTKRTLRPG
jgi:hypothetical protein